MQRDNKRNCNDEFAPDEIISVMGENKEESNDTGKNDFWLHKL